MSEGDDLGAAPKGSVSDDSELIPAPLPEWPRIKLVDQRGVPLCSFTFDAELDWCVDPPFRRKIMNYALEKAAQVDSPRPKSAELAFVFDYISHLPPSPASTNERGERRLDLPGLSLRWQKVRRVLDGIGDDGYGREQVTVTISEFRRRIESPQ
jgi:hypothetical protein